MPQKDASLIKGKFIALRAGVQVSQVDDPSKLPSRLVVFPWGKNDSSKGTFYVNDVTLSAMPLNQRLANYDRVVLDFDHNTIPESPTYKGEPCSVAAYARPVCLSGVGIVYEDIEWTDDGRKYVGGGHYRDLSPAVKVDDKDNVIFLASAAACRVGSVTDLILFSAATPVTTPKPKTSSTMDENKLKSLLCTLLGLDPEKATDEDIEAAAKAAAAPGEGGDKDPSGKSPEKKPDGDAAPDVKALSAQVKLLTASVESVLKLSEKKERDAIIALAATQGKVIPKGADKLDLADFQTLVADLPVTVPLEKRTLTLALSAGSGVISAESAIEAEVREGLGISKEVWDRHNKAA